MPRVQRNTRSRKPRKGSQHSERFRVIGHPDLQVMPDAPEPGSPAARIASVVPFLVKEAWLATRNLTPRQRAQYDLDDLIQEGWGILILRDHNYDPSRFPFETGGYLGFARLILRRHFRRVVGRSNAVRLPIKIADRCRDACDKPAVAEAVRRALRSAVTLLPETLASEGDDTLHAVERREDAERAREAVSQAIRLMDNPELVSVLKTTYGLMGSRPKSTAELAAELGTDRPGVARLRRRAERELELAMVPI